MHTIHLIAVRADDEESAIAAAEYALEPYGDGDVWDWYAVGGRWEGFLGGKNVLCYEDDPVTFMEALHNARFIQEARFREVRDLLTGRVVSPEEIPDDYNVFGLKVERSKEEIAADITERNQVACGKLQDALKLGRPPEGYEFAMTSYYLRRFTNLLGGHYCWDSAFYDAVEASTGQNYILDRINDEDKNNGGGLDEQWLVAIDLHN